jgi:hypothetical protein
MDVPDLDHGSHVPLYLQGADWIAAQVKAGKLAGHGCPLNHACPLIDPSDVKQKADRRANTLIIATCHLTQSLSGALCGSSNITGMRLSTDHLR